MQALETCGRAPLLIEIEPDLIEPRTLHKGPLTNLG